MAFGSILRSMESALTDGLVCWMVEQGDTSSGWMDGRVVREMGPSEAPLSRRLMLSGYELGADASLGPVLSAGESSTDELTRWEHHQGQIRLRSTIDRNPRSHQGKCLPYGDSQQELAQEVLD